MSTEPTNGEVTKRKKKQRSVIIRPTDEQREQIIQTLQELKPKTLTIQELLRTHIDTIESIKKTGITWSQIAQVFNEKLNINIGADSFQRAYMALTKNKNKAKKAQENHENHEA